MIAHFTTESSEQSIKKFYLETIYKQGGSPHPFFSSRFFFCLANYDNKLMKK